MGQARKGYLGPVLADAVECAVDMIADHENWLAKDLTNAGKQVSEVPGYRQFITLKEEGISVVPEGRLGQSILNIDTHVSGVIEQLSARPATPCSRWPAPPSPIPPLKGPFVGADFGYRTKTVVPREDALRQRAIELAKQTAI
ncbi:unnamed protein product [Zymoseptoria tritici ST99CH_1A5]|uniref:Uncharacterized protein n=1 Tax=Zymoseptoria tritici ST99CH_1A5 TaxID=1276529 RepID=A0A1Y6M184_ZYMTR|nr:unnamed protein product [Zymoseptoria tritici ST99CH_1A5]